MLFFFKISINILEFSSLIASTFCGASSLISLLLILFWFSLLFWFLNVKELLCFISLIIYWIYSFFIESSIFMKILWNQFVNIDKIWYLTTCFSFIVFSSAFSSSFSFISIISFCSWISPILFILFNILFTKDSFFMKFEVQFNFFSIAILLNLQNLSSNTRLFTNLRFNNIL